MFRGLEDRAQNTHTHTHENKISHMRALGALNLLDTVYIWYTGIPEIYVGFLST